MAETARLGPICIYRPDPFAPSTPSGGQTQTEYFNSYYYLTQSPYGTQPLLALGKPSLRRQSFLDYGLDASKDLVTDIGYYAELYDGKTLPSDEQTKQNGVTIGRKHYDYANGSIGANPTLDTTITQSTSDSGSLVTVTRAYSSRLSDPAFRGRPASTLRTDGTKVSDAYQHGTKVSYAYQTGTWSGNSWTAGVGPHLLVAELSGKAGSSVGTYRGVTIDSLDLDANKSVVSEKVYDASGRLVAEAAQLYTGGGFEPLSAVTSTYDALGNLVSKVADNGRVLYSACYTGFRKDEEIDEQGIKTTYAYDDYDRVKTATRAAASDGTYSIAALTTTYRCDGIGRLEKETAGAGEQLVTSYTYDTANRPTSTTKPGNLTTSIAYSPDGRTTTTTLPGGGTRITTVYADGRAKSVGGTAVPPSETSYSFDNDARNLVTTQTTAGQTVATTTDWAGRPVTVESPTFGNGTTPEKRVVTSTYNAMGQLTSQSTASGNVMVAPTRLLEYDSFGRLTREGATTGGNTTVSVSTDLGVKDYESGFQRGAPDGTGSAWYRYERVKVYPHAGGNAFVGRCASQTYTQVSGLGSDMAGSDMAAHVIAIDGDHNVTETTTMINRASARAIVETTATGTNQTFGQTSINGLVVKSTNPQGQTTLQTYDALGRLEASDDPRIGTTDFVYYPNTAMVKESTGPDSRTTGFAYDTAGRIAAQTNAAGKTAYFQYDAAGNVTHQWGQTVNPVRYEYNALGQKTKMHTYRTVSDTWTQSGLPGLFSDAGDVTTWNYQSATGLLVSKTDASNRTTSYTYNAMGQIGTRKDARGITTTYTYTPANLLWTVTYTDGTPGLTYVYDRCGRKMTVQDAAGERSFEYYDDSADTSDMMAQDRSAKLKREKLSDKYFHGHTLTYTYQYGSGINGAAQGLMLNTGELYAVSYGYDPVMRPQTVTYNGTAFTYGYVANSNLIESVTGPSGYSRVYGYRTDSNRLDKLTNQWGAGVTAESVLTYNQVGLRETEKTTGAPWMAAVGRTDPGVHADYSYTDRLEVMSSGKYQLDASGTIGALLTGTARDYQYDPIGNRTSDQAGSYTPNALNQYTGAPGVAAFEYDENGNLKRMGLRTFTYDAENRLTSVTEGGSSWQYAYDYLGRRIEKRGTGIATTRYLYDGWNVIAELTEAGTITRTFAWGLDVSGSLQGAGGVGGLLAVDDGGRKYPVYDASHNVIGLYDNSGNLAAAYEYDPFGNLQTVAGAYGAANPFRSATKYTDDKTGLVYYGMRFYSPVLGRFVNRDPIEEKGGLNLYGFCGNDGINRFDLLGMTDDQDEQKKKQQDDAKPQEQEQKPAGAPKPGDTKNPEDARREAEGKARQEAMDEHGYIGARVFGQGQRKITEAGNAAATKAGNQGQIRNSGPRDFVVTDIEFAEDTGEAANNGLAGAAQPSDVPVGRGSEVTRNAALARYRGMPDAQKKLILATFLDPNTKIYGVSDAKASEYEVSVARYQKRDGTVYYADSGVQSQEHNITDMFGNVGVGSVELKSSLREVVSFHSHSDDRIPGLSAPDATQYNLGYEYIQNAKKVSVPMDYSGAFYGKQQVFYGWTRTENYTLTFEEIRDALTK